MELKQHPLSVTAEQLLSRGWEAKCAQWAPSLRGAIVNTFPSAKHPGFVHYDVLSMKHWEVWESDRPARPAYVGTFLAYLLKPLGIAVETLAWLPTAKLANDREPMQVGEAQEYVYFIEAGPFLKIGKATGHPSARLPALRTGCPYPMTLLASMPGGLKEEMALHKRFKALHSHGEWFRHEGPLRAFVEQIGMGVFA